MLKTSPHRNFEHLVSHLCTPPYDKTTGEKFIEEEQKGALWSNVHIYMIDARNCYVNPLFRFKGAGAFHSAGQSKEGSVGFGTSQHPIFMKLLPDHLWH